jgi:hypothetical protein
MNNISASPLSSPSVGCAAFDIQGFTDCQGLLDSRSGIVHIAGEARTDGSQSCSRCGIILIHPTAVNVERTRLMSTAIFGEAKT